MNIYKEFVNSLIFLNTCRRFIFFFDLKVVVSRRFFYGERIKKKEKKYIFLYWIEKLHFLSLFCAFSLSPPLSSFPLLANLFAHRCIVCGLRRLVCVCVSLLLQHLVVLSFFSFSGLLWEIIVAVFKKSIDNKSCSILTFHWYVTSEMKSGK